MSHYGAPRPHVGLRLWEAATLTASDALLALEATWPDSPRIARAYLRQHHRRPTTPRTAPRVAAATALLGASDDVALAEAKYRAVDNAAPDYLRICALKTLGRGAAEIAAELLESPQPLSEDVRKVCEAVLGSEAASYTRRRRHFVAGSW